MTETDATRALAIATLAGAIIQTSGIRTSDPREAHRIDKAVADATWLLFPEPGQPPYDQWKKERTSSSKTGRPRPSEAQMNPPR